MEFLLECIGFPPSHDFDALAREAVKSGDPVAWRGPRGLHRALALGQGLEVHVDREDGDSGPTLSPFVRTGRRVRIAVESLRTPEDSPCDAVLFGWALDGSGNGVATTRISALLSDARLLPKRVPAGHVLAVSLTGFAVHVESLEHDPGAPLEMRPLCGPDEPAGCVEISAPIARVKRLLNPLTQNFVHRIDIDFGGRPLSVYLSPWQLFEDGLRPPRAGDRITGSFLLSGRVLGGLPSVRKKVGACFG